MVVVPDSLRLVRIEAKETAYPGPAQAARPHVAPGPILTGALDPGSRPPSTDGDSNDDDGILTANGPDPDEPKSPFSELINRPGGMVEKEEVDVELAASSNDPVPHARAHRLHAPSSLLADEPTGHHKAGLNPVPLIDQTCVAGVTIHPAPHAMAAGNREPAVEVTGRASRNRYGVNKGSDLVEVESPTPAVIAGRLQPADGPGPYPATAGPGEVAPRTWGIVLAGLAAPTAPARPDRGDAWEPLADRDPTDEDAPTDGRQLLGWSSKQVPDAKGLILSYGKKNGLPSKIVGWTPQQVTAAYRFARGRLQSTTR